MKIPYPRPTQLSNPRRDFLPSMLRNQLATPNAALKGYQLKQTLGPYLPAGTYAEAVYFLPLAFEHLQSTGDDARYIVPMSSAGIVERRFRSEVLAGLPRCKMLT